MPPSPSLAELAEIVHRGKTFGGKSAWYRLNRALSLRVTWLLVRTPVSANQVSWAMIGLGAASGLLAAIDAPYTALAAVLCLYSSYVLDRVDGEVARYRGNESWSGVYLDWLYHRLTPTLFHLGLLYRVYDRHPSRWVLAMLVAAGVLLILIKEHTEVAHNLYPRKKLSVREQVSLEPSRGKRRLRRGLFETLGTYFTPDGAALIYAPVLALDAAVGVDALTWAVSAGFLVSLAFLAQGIGSLSTGALDREVARIREEG
jgi:phosphatidylglycerophosphate synthase